MKDNEARRDGQQKLEAGLPPKQTRYPFAHTDSWEHIRRKAEAMLPARTEE